MKSFRPDTDNPVAEWHRGQTNDHVRRMRLLYGDDLARTATKAKAALGKGEVAGGGTVVTDPRGYSEPELARLLTKARRGDPQAQAEWRLYAVTCPEAAGGLIKQANPAATKGRKKPKTSFRRGRASVQVTSGYADQLAQDAQQFKNQAQRFRPHPFDPARSRAVTKALGSGGAPGQPALVPAHDPDYLAWATCIGNPTLRSRALAAAGVTNGV